MLLLVVETIKLALVTMSLLVDLIMMEQRALALQSRRTPS